ncbi:MAG: helix-turn-helix domain-containing protein [Vicinamibacterales bacterium]
MGQAIDGFYAHLGGQIRDWRHRRGLSQAELGRRLDPPVTRACIANVEKGQQRVLAHTLAQVSAILAVPVTTLLPADRPPAEAWTALATEMEATLGLSAARTRRVVARLQEGR